MGFAMREFKDAKVNNLKELTKKKFILQGLAATGGLFAKNIIFTWSMQPGIKVPGLVLEICAYNIQSCLIAEMAGATRIELCVGPQQGGVTPSYGLIKYVLEHISIPAFPMIRPRGGDFVYDAAEIGIMKKDILMCRKLGCPGIATGVLLQNGEIDLDAMRRITELAYPMQVTFHKAFDATGDAFRSLEDVMAAGCSRILTSGLRNTAVEGAGILSRLIAQAAGRIVIMPGGGVRSANIAGLAAATGATEFHSSGITPGPLNDTADTGEVEAMMRTIRSHS
jgi:copper homeostasis protein